MKKTFMIGMLWLSLLLMVSGCARQSAYFGVPNRALIVPEAFPETEQAIREAERSSGAAYCPEKIEQAKALARDGVNTYWACRDAEAMDKLAQARKLAEEAKTCQPPPPPPPPPAPPAPPPPPPPPPRVPLRDVVIERAFAFDSLRLSPEAQAVLDRQAEIIKQRPDATVEIYGYTDSVGTESYNKSLSLRRAQSAKRYLETKGIPSQRMKTFGRGEQFPIASNDTEEGRAQNRRVEIKYVE